VTGSTSLVFAPNLDFLADSRPFFGLATYYNAIRDIEVRSSLDGSNWRGWKGRFAAALIQLDDDGVEIDRRQIKFVPNVDGHSRLQIGLIDSDGQGSFGGIDAQDLRYTHLWSWLRILCLLLENSLTILQGVSGLGWGWCIILLCVAIKIALIPVTRFVKLQQRRVGEVQTALQKPLEQIKAEFDGQEAHERIMAAHKDLGVSPFYTLKPMLGMFIQVPVLVAVFNMLGELPVLSGQAFWWISDLAYPDAVLQAMGPDRAIPLLGDSLNFLPILMTVVTVASAILYKDRVAPASEVKKQKRNLYFMAVAFFILFYPFPASMVLYWATANVLQVMQQVVSKE
jgi:YidC/Oxa1 family membrane protein insertase